MFLGAKVLTGSQALLVVVPFVDIALRHTKPLCKAHVGGLVPGGFFFVLRNQEFFFILCEPATAELSGCVLLSTWLLVQDQELSSSFQFPLLLLFRLFRRWSLRRREEAFLSQREIFIIRASRGFHILGNRSGNRFSQAVVIVSLWKALQFRPVNHHLF